MIRFILHINQSLRFLALLNYITKSKIDLIRVRPLIYPNTDVFLVCFNITNPDSYDKVREKWVPEIKR